MNRGEMRTLLRGYLGEPSPGNWSNDLLNIFINRAFLEVYAEINQLLELFFATSMTFNTVSGTADYTIAAGGFSTVVLVERTDYTQPVTVWPLTDLKQKNQYESPIPGPYNDLRYVIIANLIKLAPTPTSVIPIRVYYIPVPTLPSTVGTTADAFTFPAELTDLHHDLIVWLAFIRAITMDREAVAMHMPHVNRLWDLMKADLNRRQRQEPMSFTPRED